MRITFITGHLCKERHSLLNELAIDLGKHGAKVTVLTGFPSRRISNETREYYLSHPVERISENVIVKRVGSRRGEGNSLFIRAIRYLFLTYSLYLHAKKMPSDVYYLYSSPPFLGVIGAKLARMGRKTLYNVQDIFPDSLVKIKKLSEENLVIKYLRRIEKYVYTYNSVIVTISDDMKNTLISHGCDSQKIIVIQNWADLEKLYNVKRKDNKLMDELGIGKNNFIISYAGDIGLFQAWDAIIDAIKIVSKTYNQIQFVIIGNGSYKSKLDTRIIEEAIPNVKTFPMQSEKRLPEVYSIGDFELVSLESGITKIALPSKINTIMACGSAIFAILDEDSCIASTINRNKLGYTCPVCEKEELANHIINCYKARDSVNIYKQNVITYVRRHNNRSIQTRQYYEILKRIVNEDKLV